MSFEQSKLLQDKLFNSIKTKLQKGENIAQVLMEDFGLSKDACYRRLRGEVSLSIYETKYLCEKYSISFDEMGLFKKGKVSFDYRPLDAIEFNFESYLTRLRDGMKQIKSMPNPKLHISVNDTPIFQLFNFPHLTRFKFFFWAKTYLNIPDYRGVKFKKEKIDPKILQIGIEAHNIYNSIPSYEVYCPETLRGFLRQIEYYFDSEFFEDNNYVLTLLDNLLELSNHMKMQAEVGHKFAYGNEPVKSERNAFNMYSNDTYLPDNTYYIQTDIGDFCYFTHNIMNFLQTSDPNYNKDTKDMMDRLMNNSTLISVVSAKERNRFFASLNRTILSFRKKIELELGLASVEE